MESKILSTQTAIDTYTELEQTYQSFFSNNVIPILDHLSQLFLPFQSFEFIQVFFCILQIMESSFWIDIGKYWKKTKLEKILRYLTYFSSFEFRPKEIYILFSILLILVLLATISFFTLVIHYKNTRRTIRPVLYIVRFYFILFGAVILHPLASLIGKLITVIITDKKYNYIIMLIFAVICYILANVLFYFNQHFVNQSIYIHKSLWATFDSTLYYIFYILDPFFQILSNLFQFYPIWSFYILVICHIIIIIISLLNYLWMPCILSFSNCSVMSIICSMIFNSIFRMIVENFDQIKCEYFIIICYLTYIIFTIISFFVFKHARKKINSFLSFSPDEVNSRPSDHINDEKYLYFEDLGLGVNIYKAKIYLIVGFTTGSENFVDFSLIQFCIDRYKDDSTMLILLMHLLSYFKSEKNCFDIVLKHFHSLRGTSLFERFIYFQCHRVKIFRQSTSTTFSTSRLNDLKTESIVLENQIKAFWSLEFASTNLLYQLEQKERKLNDLWDESIEDNWTSTIFRELHIRFLIESKTDFLKAVQMTNIKDKIDILRSERDDLCFLSLVSCFPNYLNKKIVDLDGNFITKKSGKDSSTASSINAQNEKYSTSSYDSDFTYDEQIANTILKNGRLRLSMQNALKYVKPTMGKALIIYSIILILVTLIAFITLFALYVNSYDSFDDWNTEIGVLIELRLAYARSFFCLTVLFGQKTNKFLIDDFDCNITCEQNQYFIDFTVGFDELAYRYIDDARNQFSNLISSLLDLAMNRVDISTLTGLFFDQIITTNICYFDKIIDKVNWSMEQILGFEILSFSILAEDEENEVINWFDNNTYWCHDITTFPDVENMFTTMQNALSDDLREQSIKTSEKIFLQMYTIGPINLAIFIIPFPFLLYFYVDEINHLIKMMLSTDSDYKEQARKSISLASSNDTNEIIPQISKSTINWRFFAYSFIVFLSFCSFIAFEELILYFAKEINIKLRNIGVWSCNFSLLRSFMVELLIELINSVFFTKYDKSYTSNSLFRTQLYGVLKSLETFLYDILNDTPISPSSMGMDETIDSIVLQASCESSELNNLHDSYKCGSLNRLLATIHSLVHKIAEEIKIYNGTFKGEELSNVYHIISAHAITQLISAADRFSDLHREEVNNYNQLILIFFICGLIFIIIFTLFLFIIISNLKRIFDMAICLTRRLSPIGLINNTELTNYLLYKKGEEIEMGVTHTIFNNSFDGIICMNLDGIVEIINKSFATDYGYSTEQLVGQMVGSIFDNESRMKLENQLKLIKNHESTSYKQDVICYTNDGRAIPSFITLFGIKGNENSLILVVRDETILLQKKKRLELAKKQSQDLLEQIMPPKVLLMLKEGKSEISFAVPSASVMFVDIVNFSGFSSDLSPQQIMGTLSTLIGAFDVWIQKYPLMTKIKLIGDTYMAACGLFAVELDPKNHAKQCIDFSLKVFNILDDVNIKLNFQLQIRIGVNSDGPIIAGVLGTENRVFDIIGDTINVASRLEHKSEPGHILMSEKTYDLVKDYGYDIISIGKVFLKGKGDMPAYQI